MSDELVATGGWCAPGDYFLDLMKAVQPQHMVQAWPAGLLPEDIEWLAQMMHAGQIEPEQDWNEFPEVSVRRGALRFPVPGEVTP